MGDFKPIKIMSMPVDDGGCGNYRVRQPFEMIKKYTESDSYIVSKDDDMVDVAKAMLNTDVFVVRQGGEGGLQHLLQRPEYKGKPWVLDIDDNVEVISPYSEHYKEYGTEEFYDNNSKTWIWKDGVGGFDVAKNRLKIQSLINGMKNANLVTVTTHRLAKYASQYNKNVAVLPNAINMEKWWPLPFVSNTQLRVGWSGGISHYEDWYSIKEPLNRLMREYQFKLVMVGSHFDGIIDPDNKHLVENHEWVPFKGHSYRMMCMNLDLAIIPLADLPFNHYKSSIKFYEFSAMGVGSLVANVAPYSDDIRHLDNALGYSSSKQFYDYAKMLLDDKKRLRNSIGREARKWVNDNRNAQKLADLWVETYKEVINGC